jgi:YVTN family beta-propeller protein
VGVAVTPDGAAVYVTNASSGTVSVIGTATNTVTATIGVGIFPYDVAVTPDQAPDARLTVAQAPAWQATTFDASASTVKYGTIASYQWDFGDGATQTTTTPIVTHAYAAPGRYTVTLTETSSGGTSTTRVFTGRTVSRNGGPQARTTATVTIGPTPTPTPTVTPTVTPTPTPVPWMPVTG